MKTKEKKELLEKSMQELEKMVLDAKAKLFSSAMEKQVGKLSDLRLMSKTRDEIAVLKTFMRMKREKGEKHA